MLRLRCSKCTSPECVTAAFSLLSSDSDMTLLFLQRQLEHIYLLDPKLNRIFLRVKRNYALFLYHFLIIFPRIYIFQCNYMCVCVTYWILTSLAEEKGRVSGSTRTNNNITLYFVGQKNI